MSADDGTYVLATMGTNGEPEYRVAAGQAIEVIFEDPDLLVPESDPGLPWTYGLNSQMVLDWFGLMQVFTDRDEALQFAREKDGGSTEYGVEEYDFTSLQFPDWQALLSSQS